jgi:hypothetical protein
LEPFDVPVTLVARTARDGVHGVDELPRLLPRAYRLVGRQVRRYVTGEPLDNVVTDGY